MVPNFLVARLTASFTRYKSTQIQLGSQFQYKYNDFIFFINSFASGTFSDSESDGNHHKGDAFTMSYLINSCGVSPKRARELSKRVNLKNPDGPNAVIELLKHYGFSKTHVAKLVEKQPLLLNVKAEVTLLPKLKFFHSIGVSNTEMPKIIIANYTILLRSLKKCLIPRYEVLRSVVRNDREVIKALKNAPRSFTYCDLMNHLVPNIEVLGKSCVRQSSISLLIMNFPTVAYGNNSRFAEVVKTVEEIGFNPLQTTFVMGVQVLMSMREVVWESRFEFYGRWGWSRDMVLRAFRKFPNFMKLSEEMVTKKMSFLVKDMDVLSEDIAEYPVVLGYSLEKRIIPRFCIIKMLKSKGLLENNLHLSSFICPAEEIFLKKFVINFKGDLPFLPDVYKYVISHGNVI